MFFLGMSLSTYSFRPDAHKWVGASAKALYLGVCLITAMSPLQAQVIRDVTPEFVVAGEEARFTASGFSLPVTDAPNRGLKISTVPANACTSAKRYAPATPSRYFFACTPKADVKSFVLRIVAQEKGRSYLLWSGEVSVLSGPPAVSAVTVTAPAGEDPGPRIQCGDDGACLTVSGDARLAGDFQIEAEGATLPPKWTVEAAGCRTERAVPGASGRLQARLQCLVRDPEDGRPMKIWSAEPSRGGKVLWQGTMRGLLPAVSRPRPPS